MIEIQKLQSLLRLTYTALLLLSLTGCESSKVLPQPLVADCRWFATVSTWRDDNRDGQRQANESSLDGVNFTVEGNPSIKDGGVTDQRGFASIGLHLWKCSGAQFTVRATPPPGYRATTPVDVPVQYDLPRDITTVHGKRLDQQASTDPIPLAFGFTKN